MAMTLFRSVLNSSKTARSQLTNTLLSSHTSLRHSLHSAVCLEPPSSPVLLNVVNLGITAVRSETTWIRKLAIRPRGRDNWPRPSEKIRQKMNFFNRMSTPGGRAVIMRRYLKGRHVLSH